MSAPDDAEICRERRALEIVEELLDLAASERSTRLDAICGEDRSLRDRVLTLVGRLDDPASWLEASRAVREGGDDPVGAFLDARPEVRRWIEAEIDEEASDATDGPEDLDTTPARDTILLADLSPETGARYRDPEEIARGGMGVIYRVWDHVLRRRLAMKVRRERSDPTGSSPSSVDGRFLEEAQVTSQLDHPGVVPLHDVGLDASQRPFFTMRFVEGKDLTEVIDDARESRDGWTQTRVLDVLVRVCETLSYAHSKGVVHRDLKPRNVRVGRYGETYVMDWGLAKIIRDEKPSESSRRAGRAVTTVREEDDSDGWTLDGTVVGTPAFMPPEQAGGRPELVGAASDVYAVGAMLYALLAGHAPYGDSDADLTPRRVLEAVRSRAPTPLAIVSPRAPAELVAICEKAMEREIQDRYPSMEALREDLRAFLENRVVRAHRSGAWAELRKWILRNQAVALASVAVALVLAVGLVVSLSLLKYVADEKSLKETALGELQIASATTERALGEKSRALDAQDVALEEKARALRESETRRLAAQSRAALETDPALALLLAKEAYAIVPSRETREALFDARVALREERTLLGHRVEVTGVWFASGDRLVSAARDGTVRVWDLARGEEVLRLLGHRGGINGVICDPSGERALSWGWDAEVRVWELAGGGLLHVLRHEQVVDDVVVDGAGRRALTTARDGIARVWNLATGRLERELVGHEPVTLPRCDISRDGTRGATASTDGTARVWDLASGTCLQVVRHPRVARVDREAGGRDVSPSLSSCRLSVDGRRVLTAGTDDVARVFDVETGAELVAFRGHSGWIQDAIFSADESRVITASTDATLRVWDTASGRGLRTLEGHRGPVLGVRLLGDGWRALSISEDRTARVWDLIDGSEVEVLRGHGGAVLCAAVDPSGERVATGSRDGTARLWSTPSRRAAPWRVAAGWWRGSAWSEDGTRVALLGSGAHVTVIEVGSLRETRLEGHEKEVLTARFFADSKRVVTGSLDGSARIWSLDGDRAPLVLEGHTAAVEAVAVSSNAERIATGSRDGSVRIWRASDGVSQTEIRRRYWHPVGIDFSPDSRFVAVVGWVDTAARVFEVTTGDSVCDLPHSIGWLNAVAFDTTGERLVVGSHLNTMHVWSLRDVFEARGRRSALVDARVPRPSLRALEVRPRPVAALEGHRSDLVHASFASARGDRLLTLHADGELFVWDLESSEALVSLSLPGDWPRRVRLLADGEHFVTLSAGGEETTWTVDASDLSRLPAPRRLLEAERALYTLGTEEERRREAVREAERGYRDSVRLARRALELDGSRRSGEEQQIDFTWADFFSMTRARGDLARSGGSGLTLSDSRPELVDEVDLDPSHVKLVRLLESHLENDRRPELTHEFLRRVRAEVSPLLPSYSSVDAQLDAWRRATLLPTGAAWRVAPASVAIEAGTEWTRPEHDDAAWISTSLPVSDESHKTSPVLRGLQADVGSVCFRGRFQATLPATLERVRLHLHARDGFVAWLNGREVYRHAAGAPGAATSSSSRASSRSSAHEAWVEVPLPISRIRAGENVIAIQLLDFGDSNWSINAHVDAVFRVLPPEASAAIAAARAALEARGHAAGLSGVAAYLEASLAYLADDPAGALARLERVGDESPSPSVEVSALRVLSLRALGDEPAARAELDAALEIVGVEGLDEASGEALSSRAWSVLRLREQPLRERLRAARWALRGRAVAASLDMYSLGIAAIARARLGLHEDAARDLRLVRATAFFRPGGRVPPRVIGFLALCEARLGRAEEAEAVFNALFDSSRTVSLNGSPYVLEIADELGFEVPAEAR